MSLPIIILIMLLAGISGGVINFYLASNTDADGKKIKEQMVCIIMGIGATILVPLFLEIAQSKLMDNIHFGMVLQKEECDCNKAKNDTLNLNVILKDTTRKALVNAVPSSDTAKVKIPMSTAIVSNAANCCVPLKSYFLFLAYCLVAAAAGIRFINSITDSVLKDKQIANLKDKNEKTEAEKEAAEEETAEAVKARIEAEKQKAKFTAQARIAAVKLEESLPQVSSIRMTMAENNLPVIGPVTNEDDPQKGRFGGKAINNNRHLKATVKKALIPDFYNVKIWVESTDALQNPLQGECIFYIHDSFRPSVYPVTVVDGIAMDDQILSYGAFTVGVVADRGQTLLELDLAEQMEFPKQFRER